jgi:long-chain acyl-CoA synthetase
MTGGTLDGYESYEKFISKYPISPITDECEGQDMLYSSGTTGRPKGIVPPNLGSPIGYVEPSSVGFFNLFGFDVNTVYISPAPLYHAAPLRFCMMVLRTGGTVVVMERFDAETSLALIEKHKATHSQWVPTMFIRMLKLPEEERKKFDISSLKVSIHAAAPIPIPVKEEMIKWWGPILFEYYGATEGNGITMITSEDWLAHKGSVGRAVVGEIHILDEDENELPMGEPGIVYFGDGNPFEYHNDPEKLAETTSSHGWTTIGDIGYVDEDGYLYLTDRKANMIISGGVNIYPQEAENVLVGHPKVLDVAVIGVPNEEFGEEVKAVVQPKDMADAGPDLEMELIGFCRQHLSKIKCPASVDFEEKLPRTPTGKLFKRRLRDRYWND